jgi:hypothetical protein
LFRVEVGVGRTSRSCIEFDSNMHELTNEESRTASMIRQAADRVESLTRFDLSSISAAEAETIDVPVACELRYVVSFNRVDHAGYGALPNGTISMPNKAALDSYIQNLRITAEQGFSERLTRWIADHCVPPEPPLAANDCYEESSPAGYIYTCGGCSGKGQVRCTSCGGSREVRCFSCGGSGKASCSGCGGRGSNQKTRWTDRQVYNPTDNRTYTQSYMESYEESCFSCSGSGKQVCYSCHGGWVTCSLCSGTGSISCSSCHGSGRLVAVARLTCMVGSFFGIHATTTLSEAQQKLEALPTLTALAMLAPVRRTQAKVEGNSLGMSYTASVQVTRLQVTAAQQQFDMLGYGNAASVENFKNIVGLMLENDLSELERSLQKAPWILLRPNQAIDAALSNMLRSEIHSRIVTEIKPSATNRKGPSPLGLDHSVSEEYVAHAARTIKDSLIRLYRGHGLAGTALALGAIAVLAIAIYLLRLNEFLRLLAFAGSFVVALFAGWLYEWLAMRQLCSRFGAPLAERLVSLFKMTRSLGMWYAVGFGVTFLATVLAVFGTGGLWLDSRQQEYDEAKATFQREEAKAALRREEAKATLRRESEQRVKTALSAVVAAKPGARHYLLTCLQDSATRKRVAGFSVMQAYGPYNPHAMDWAELRQMFRAFKNSNSDAEKYAQDGGMQMALIDACKAGKVPAAGFDGEAWIHIFKPLYYEGSPAYRTSYLNLLNTDGESGDASAAEARRLAELIPPFLVSVGVSLGD